MRLSGFWCLLVALVASIGVGRAQFSSGVNLVEVYATVTDKSGSPVRNLSKEEFELREDGVAQAISAFTAGQFPLSAAVAIDRSFSMSGDRLAAAKAAASAFLNELRPDDESMILAIGSTVDVVAPLSRDRSAQTGAVSALDAFGTTGLYDAIVAAIDAIQPARGRRGLVLLSDGSDRYSRISAADALARAREAEVLIYPIAFGRTRPPIFAELASLTGGRSYHVTDARKLPETVRAIAAELRSQYLLGYSPSKPIVPGSNTWRSISVAVKREGVTVRARDGYVAR